MIMNSCRSMELSAWTPPLTTFIIGTGQHVGVGAADVAEQGQARARRRPPWPWPASTPRMALAPSRALLGVPSASIRARSTARWSRASTPSRMSAISPLTLADRLAGRPCRRSGRPPSRSSTASNDPVEAPDGTMARPTAPGVEDDLDLDGGIAAGVEDLAADDLLDDAHCVSSLLLPVCEKLPSRTLRTWEFAIEPAVCDRIGTCTQPVITRGNVGSPRGVGQMVPSATAFSIHGTTSCEDLLQRWWSPRTRGSAWPFRSTAPVGSRRARTEDRTPSGRAPRGP